MANRNGAKNAPLQAASIRRKPLVGWRKSYLGKPDALVQMLRSQYRCVGPKPSPIVTETTPVVVMVNRFSARASLYRRLTALASMPLRPSAYSQIQDPAWWRRLICN